MKLQNRILLFKRLSLLLLLSGILVMPFTWYGIFLELAAFLLMIYLSRYGRITWWRIFSLSTMLAFVFAYMFFKYHTTRMNFIEPDWNLMPSSEKYYFDPLYAQRQMNMNFDSLMMDKNELEDIDLYTSDTEGVPPEAPVR